MNDDAVLVLLDAPQLLRLRSVALPPWRLTVADSWTALEQQVSGFSGTLLIDPPLPPPEKRNPSASVAFERTVRGMLDDSPQPVILYIPAAKIAAVGCLQRRGSLRLVVQGVDDSNELLRYHVNESLAEVTYRRLTRALAAALPFLDSTLCAALQRSLLGNLRPDNVSSLASIAGRSRSGLYRDLQRAGIRSPVALLRLLRVTQAYCLLHYHGQPGRVVCEALGDASGRSLRGAVRACVGSGSLKALGQLAPSTFVRLCVDRLEEAAPFGDGASTSPPVSGHHSIEGASTSGSRGG